MKKLLFIATGGTIASGDSGSGLSPEASAEELLSGVNLPDAEIHAIQPFALDSTDLTPQHWMEVAALIRDRWQDFDGFVITHGTDTMAVRGGGAFLPYTERLQAGNTDRFAAPDERPGHRRAA